MSRRFDASGRCTLCAGGWLCPQCQVDTQASYDRRWLAAGRAVRAGRAAERGRLAASLELESDEAGTAEEKAGRILAGYSPVSPHFMISRA